jgi:hypothetical protein
MRLLFRYALPYCATWFIASHFPSVLFTSLLCVLCVPMARAITPNGGRTFLLLVAGFYTSLIVTPLMAQSWLSIPHSMLLVIVGVHVGILLWGIEGFWSTGNKEVDESRNMLVRTRRGAGHWVFAIMAPSLCGLAGAIVAYLLFLLGRFFS